ncbi:PREDICTED: doublecortin domain-containing protein 2 isoform X3 [Crocodylus porosus]|uniref:doublecortin domain-containing protein 2 isoform X3 n=1 Tax=Crocodylus porosus TaxID=8502 RepID=UPI00093EAABA|nr:PREDICTED: doublecortin domain-containing protein 2 isoform X3 [Crocodylus porosus]
MSSPSTKPSCLSQPMVKSVLVYRNGDPFFPGRRIVISEKKVSNFEVFLKEVTGGVKAPFGAVRNIYTPRGGHRIRQLEELQSGEHYVAGGREAFKKLNYLDIGEAKKKPVEVNNEVLSRGEKMEDSSWKQVKPVTHSRINVSARFRKPLQEPCTIFLIANGDIINPAVRLFIPRKTLTQWEHVLEMVTEKITLRSGAVHRLYTLDGKLVQSGSDLENGQFYIAVGRDKFKKLPYGDLLFSKSTIRRPQGSKASSLPPIAGSRKSKGSGNDRQSKSTVGSSDTGEMVSSPQPPKRKEKKTQNQEESHSSKKNTKVKQNVRVATSTYALQDNDEGVYKAGERSEMLGAAEVQEDEDTRVEVPVDQRPAETVDEEENDQQEEEKDEGKETYGEMNGEEHWETVNERNGLKENEEEVNGHYEEEQGEDEEVGSKEEDETTSLNGKTNAENGEAMEQVNHSEEEAKIQEELDRQSQADSHPEKTSTNPRVTITSPQESEKNEQTNEYAAVA